MWPFDILSKKDKYWAKEARFYYSKKFDETVSWPKGYGSDGATGGVDWCWLAFFAHDRLCKRGTWDSGKPVKNWQASCVYSTILWEKGFYLQSLYSWPVTFVGGGKNLKKF